MGALPPLRRGGALFLVDGELVLGADPGRLDGRLHRHPVRDRGLLRAGEHARRQELGLCKRQVGIICLKGGP